MILAPRSADTKVSWFRYELGIACGWMFRCKAWRHGCHVIVRRYVFFINSSRCSVPGPGIIYTGPREILLELITNLNVI